MAYRPMSKTQVVEGIADVTGQACLEWERLKDKHRGRLKLYYRYPNRRQRVGRLRVAAADPGRGWRLACDMRFSSSWNRKEAEHFIHNRVVTLPILRGPFKDYVAN